MVLLLEWFIARTDDDNPKKGKYLSYTVENQYTLGANSGSKEAERYGRDNVWKLPSVLFHAMLIGKRTSKKPKKLIAH